MKNLIYLSIILVLPISLRAQWNIFQLPSSLNTEYEALYFVNENLGFAGGYQVGNQWGLHKFTNNASSVVNNYQDEYNNVTEVQFVDEDFGVMATTDGLLLTYDGGNSWEEKYATEQGSWLSDVQFLDLNIGFTISFYEVHKTIDGGQTWETLTAPELDYHELRGIHFVDEQTGIIVAEDGVVSGGKILRTTDGGNSWIEVLHLDSEDGHLREIEFFDSQNGVVGGVQTLYYTSDGGATWQPSSFDEEIYNIHDITMTSPSKAYASTPDGIIVSTDGGASYEYSLFVANNLITSIHFIDEDHGYAVGYFNRLYTTTNGGGSTSSLPKLELPEKALISPNPVNVTLQVELRNKNAGQIKVQVYSSFGTPIYESFLSVQPESIIDLPTHDFKNGFYMLNIYDEHDTQIYSSNFVVQH